MSDSALKLVKTYCYFAIAAAIYGILWSHLPIILGSGWITCIGCPNRLVCLLKFHAVIAPTVLFNLYIAWYGLKRFSELTVAAFRSLLTFAGAFNFVFFVFEVDAWNESWQRGAPLWQSIALTTIILMLLGGSYFAVYVNHKLLEK